MTREMGGLLEISEVSLKRDRQIQVFLSTKWGSWSPSLRSADFARADHTLIATRNDHKVGEIRAILGERFHCLTPRDFPNAPKVIEDAETFCRRCHEEGVVELAKWLARGE